PSALAKVGAVQANTASTYPSTLITRCTMAPPEVSFNRYYPPESARDRNAAGTSGFEAAKRWSVDGGGTVGATRCGRARGSFARGLSCAAVEGRLPVDFSADPAVDLRGNPPVHGKVERLSAIMSHGAVLAGGCPIAVFKHQEFAEHERLVY